jgi:flagellar biosynthesis chaperone FliJ
LAHELQEIYPELVTGEKDGIDIQSVNYNGLIPILINEIQNLKKEIKTLKQELEDKGIIKK